MNIIEIYRNYLHSIETRKEYGDQYGDTDEIIKRYEDILEQNGIKIKRLILEKKENKKSQ